MMERESNNILTPQQPKKTPVSLMAGTWRIIPRYDFTLNTASRSYDACILGQKVDIDVTLTKVNAIVDDFLTSVKSRHQGSPNCLIVGFDVEILPINSTFCHIATINFCIGRRVLIYQLPYLPYNVLHPFFSDNSNIFVGINIKAKLRKLNNVYGVGGNARCVDLGERAAERYNRPELKKEGLMGLSKVVLGKEVCKPGVISYAWHKEPLSRHQVLHACVDAFVPHELGHALVGPIPRETQQLGQQPVGPTFRETPELGPTPRETRELGEEPVGPTPQR